MGAHTICVQNNVHFDFFLKLVKTNISSFDLNQMKHS